MLSGSIPGQDHVLCVMTVDGKQIYRKLDPIIGLLPGKKSLLADDYAAALHCRTRRAFHLKNPLINLANLLGTIRPNPKKLEHYLLSMGDSKLKDFKRCSMISPSIILSDENKLVFPTTEEEISKALKRNKVLTRSLRSIKRRGVGGIATDRKVEALIYFDLNSAVISAESNVHKERAKSF